MNKKYILFTGKSNTYGWDGFRGAFDSVDDAILVLLNLEYNWAEIVDIEQLKVVWTEFGRD